MRGALKRVGLQSSAEVGLLVALLGPALNAAQVSELASGANTTWFAGQGTEITMRNTAKAKAGKTNSSSSLTRQPCLQSCSLNTFSFCLRGQKKVSSAYQSETAANQIAAGGKRKFSVPFLTLRLVAELAITPSAALGI